MGKAALRAGAGPKRSRGSVSALCSVKLLHFYAGKCQIKLTAVFFCSMIEKVLHRRANFVRREEKYYEKISKAPVNCPCRNHGAFHGGLQQQFETLSGMGAGVDYTVSRTYCTREALEGIALGIALNTNYLPSDAEAIGFDAETQMFIFGDPTSGQTLDREALYSDIESAFEQGGGEVELKYDYTEGEVPVDGYGLIATYTTDASTSSSARLHNIRLALSTINGTCVEPGEVFSFNGVVGERTKAAGYRPAPAYSRMETVMEYGGGICQVSSTLYAAVEKAGLEIVERHSHSLKVTYIPKGMDATVDWGNKDFKFANNTSEAIYIVGYVDGFEQVHINLYGRL